MGQGETYFARKATGLVRQISAFDSFVFNANFTNAGLAVTYILLTVLAFHPNADIVTATAIAMLMAIPTAVVHGMLAATFPRSGGEYVYISRILNPALGFAANWNMTLWLLFYIGIPCALFARYGFAVVLRFLGVGLGNSGLIRGADWFATPTGTFAVGTALLFVLVLLSIKGLNQYARIQNVFFVLATLSLCVVALELLRWGTGALGHLDRYIAHFIGTADPRRAVVELARKGGFSVGRTDWKETFLVLSWPGYFLFWGNASTYIGGEVKDAARAQTKALPAATLFCAFWIILVVWLFEKTLGREFLGSLAYIPAHQLRMAFTPTFAELAAATTGSTFVGGLIVVCFAFWTYVWAPVDIAIVTRNFLAWSLDRLAPEKLSQVHPRLHTPVTALMVCGVGGEVFLALYAYLPQFALLVGVFGVFITFMVTSLAGALLPFRKPGIFRTSPAQRRLYGIPLITIMGGLSFLFLACVEVSLVLDPITGISIFPSADAGSGRGVPFFMFLFNVAVLASGFIVYHIARAVRSRRGIDIGFAFREIPPE
jgi:amino acid transporter